MIKRDRQKDLAKLADAFFDNLERESACEYGGWGLDDKRPFGNSSVEYDILEIVGCRAIEGEYSEEQREYAHSIYDDLGDYLKAKWKKFHRQKQQTLNK